MYIYSDFCDIYIKSRSSFIYFQVNLEDFNID